MTDKQSRDKAISKREAFKSFLEVADTQQSGSSPAQEAYEEEYVEGNNLCNVCGDMPDESAKSISCGFCKLNACKSHLRKRRKKKEKWEKICDTCQEKFLYNSYMKLEKKAEESLAVEEEIMAMKYEDVKEVLRNKETRRRELSFKEQEIISEHEKRMKQYEIEENRLMSLSNRIESDELLCQQLEEYNARMSAKIKDNFEEDYQMLGEESEKIGKELATLNRKCEEVKTAISKREQEIEDAYQQWERKQYSRPDFIMPSPNRDKQKCQIF